MQQLDPRDPLGEPENYKHVRLVMNALDAGPCEVESYELDDDTTEIIVRCDDETVHHVVVTTRQEPKQ